MCRTNNRTPRNVRKDGDEATSEQYSGTAVQRYGETSTNSRRTTQRNGTEGPKGTRVANARHRKQRY
jgi:hypothetical protein